MSDYDTIVIGAGPGGYVCAIRLAQLGQKVAIVEKRGAKSKKGPSLGGTCLNVGCIPSKALLDSSEHYHNAKEHFSEHGIGVGELSLDMKQMLKRKDKVVTALTGGIGLLMKKNKVDVLAGTGSVVKPGLVKVGKEEYPCKNIVLAMGSEPVELPFLKFDKETIVSSTEALCFDSVPEHLAVVGGGVIGLELGSVYARLGAKVSVIEFMPQIVPGFDKDVSKAFQKALKKIGFDFHLNCKVTGYADGQISFENAKGESQSFAADKVLVSVGRKAYTAGAGLEEAGVKLDERGRVEVNERFESSVPGIFAIGDLIHGPMLAHKAEEDGVAVAENIAGGHGHVDYKLVPGAVYTWPELANIGLSEEQAKEQGYDIKVGKFGFMANGRAKASGDTDGFVKVVTEAKTDKLLGVVILGPRASDLIGECTAVMAYGGSAEDIAVLCHAHPTFSEAVKEAALDANGRLIHG